MYPTAHFVHQLHICATECFLDTFTDDNINGRQDLLVSARQRLEARAAVSSEEDDNASGASSSEDDDQSDEAREGDSSSSEGASDLEGIPVASAQVGDAEPITTKRSKPGGAQSITEEGASSKIGVVFGRILEKHTKKGILSVRTPHCHTPCSACCSSALFFAVHGP
jgi:hypothetical protein